VQGVPPEPPRVRLAAVNAGAWRPRVCPSGVEEAKQALKDSREAGERLALLARAFTPVGVHSGCREQIRDKTRRRPMALRIPEELVMAARAGDLTALNSLLARSRQDLRRYAEHHCEINDVEDAVQETLFQASRRLQDLRRVEALVSWLFRIVKRECNRMRRTWRRIAHLPLDPSLEPVVTPAGSELRVEIGRVLAALPMHYREILLMRDVDGLTLNEIADVLELSLPAVKSRLHRARMLARERLGGAADDACGLTAGK
jgi:RNA polymerase sigma factor (sigma-70 family)